MSWNAINIFDKVTSGTLVIWNEIDRIVKNLFKDSADGFLVNKKVIVPSEEECKINTRARSAKLRIFQKGALPEKPDKFALRRAQRG